MESQHNQTTVTECASYSVCLDVGKTTFLTIKLTPASILIGCANNTVTTVEEFIVEDTIFQGVKGESGGTALVLNSIMFAKITKSLFISNIPHINSQRHHVREFVTGRHVNIVNYFRLQPNDLKLYQLVEHHNLQQRFSNQYKFHF